MSLSGNERRWLQDAVCTMGPLPEKYIALDVESSGLNREKDLALQVGLLIVDGDRSEFSSFEIDWVSEQLPDFVDRLSERLDKTRTTLSEKGEKYAFTLDRLQKSGIKPLDAAIRLQDVAQRHGPDYWLVSHNGFAVDVPYTDRLSDMHRARAVSFNRPYVDTMVIERCLQLQPRVEPGETWTSLCEKHRYLGGSKIKCNLQVYCTNKYGLPVKSHEADRDAVKMSMLLDIYRKGSMA